MAEKDADVQKIKELIKVMKENDLVEIDIRHGDDQISLKRAQPPQPGGIGGPIIASLPGAIAGAAATGEPASALGQTAAAAAQEELLEVKSPIVGTFYEGPSPDSDPYVDIDSRVDPQTVVGIIEAMKVMNEIKAEVGGTVVAKCVTNGQAIEYGQVLFKIRPD